MTTDGGIGRFITPKPVDTVPGGRPSPVPAGKTKKAVNTAGINSFSQILEQQTRIRELSFSAHAKQRLQDRSIELGPEEMGKLAEAVDKAAAKGCRASLLLYGDMAFVAGVDNRTIITALDGRNMKEHVFTNIDSALIVE